MKEIRTNQIKRKVRSDIIYEVLAYFMTKYTDTHIIIVLQNGACIRKLITVVLSYYKTFVNRPGQSKLVCKWVENVQYRRKMCGLWGIHEQAYLQDTFQDM